MKNGNEKIAALKAKYKDKSLSRSERQQVAEELVREMYKIDKRKPISQRAVAKRYMVSGLIAMLAGVGYFIYEGLEISGTNAETAVNALVFIAAFGLLCWLVVPIAAHKHEPDDEFSKHNKLKAGSIAGELTGVTGVIACFVASSVLPEVVTVNRESFYFIMYIVIGLYYFTYYAAFLKLEGKPGEEGEDE